MFLKNYTSDVPVPQTIHRIEQVLIRCGVSGITKDYTGTTGEIQSLTFHLETASGKIPIRIPVNEKSALDALWMDYANGEKLFPDGGTIHWNSRKKKGRKDFVEQAKRTAWKIMQDWIEVQLSMIQMKQADTLEVFLPYVVTNDGQSYYKALVGQKFAGLLPAPTE